MVDSVKPLTFSDKFKNEFLSVDESNEKILLDKIKTIFDVLRDNKTNSARRDIAPFRYDKNILNSDFFCTDGHDFDVLCRDIKDAFGGTIKWHSPYAAFNITPTPIMSAVAVSTITQLLNPNSLWDITGGKTLLYENKIINMLGRTILKTSNVSGFSTFGGKATLLYAIKSGIVNCDGLHKKQGLHGQYVVFASSLAHYSLEDLCDYLGLGTDAVKRVPTDEAAEMRYDLLEQYISDALSHGKKIAAIICNGGTTIDFAVDNVKKIRIICDKQRKKYQIPYDIYIHGDTVFGWAWLLLNRRKLDMYPKAIKKKLDTIYKKLLPMRYADSIGADFHKMLLCPYISSFFVTKGTKARNSLGGFYSQKKNAYFGDLHPHYNTLENSRSASGIMSAYAALCLLGKNGITEYIGYLYGIQLTMLELIDKFYSKTFRVLNSKSPGFEIVLEINIDGKVFDEPQYLHLCESLRLQDDTIMVSSVFGYSCEDNTKKSGLLLYSMSPHATQKSCEILLRKIATQAKITAKTSCKHNTNIFVPK